MHDTHTDRHNQTNLGLPAFSVAIGVAYLVVGLVGDDIGFGIFGLLLMTGVAVVLVVAARWSETVAGLMNRRDERINDIDLRATTFAGSSVLVAVLVMFMVEIARGHDPSPYAALAALGGVAYTAAVVYLRFRR